MKLSKFIGIKYRDKGRTFKGADCWGIVMLYYKEILNINVPDFVCSAENPRRVFSLYLYQISKFWVECNEFKKDYVVAMCTNSEHPKLITHFGVMIDDKTLLHSYEGVESHITDINSPIIKNTIKGVYRWR